MVDHICPRCDKKLSSKNSLNTHIINETCLKHKCKSCNRKFTRNGNFLKHINNNLCKKVNLPKLTLKKKLDGTEEKKTSRDINLTNSDISESDGSVIGSNINSSNLQSMNQRSSNKTINKNTATNSYNQTTNKNNTKDSHNSVNINFPAKFGTEDMNVVCQKLGDILTPLIDKLKCGPVIDKSKCEPVVELFNKIHNSPELPQYHNVYAPPSDYKIAYISDGQVFKKTELNQLLEDIIEKQREILGNFVENTNKLSVKVIEEFEKYQLQLDDNNNYMDDMKKTIKTHLVGYGENISNKKENEEIKEDNGR